MSIITFDTHAFVKKLKAVGFTEEQADVFANEQATLIEDMATKHVSCCWKKTSRKSKPTFAVT
ncbi:MAG: CCDC90 family protein [Sulfuricellaceae bacterium]|nr:CCDC90 family protein [Sulfuricellaceae bacterium]